MVNRLGGPSLSRKSESRFTDASPYLPPSRVPGYLKTHIIVMIYIWQYLKYNFSRLWFIWPTLNCSAYRTTISHFKCKTKKKHVLYEYAYRSSENRFGSACGIKQELLACQRCFPTTARTGSRESIRKMYVFLFCFEAFISRSIVCGTVTENSIR